MGVYSRVQFVGLMLHDSFARQVVKNDLNPELNHWPMAQLTLTVVLKRRKLVDVWKFAVPQLVQFMAATQFNDSLLTAQVTRHCKIYQPISSSVTFSVLTQLLSHHVLAPGTTLISYRLTAATHAAVVADFVDETFFE